jgi:hypothetical protein
METQRIEVDRARALELYREYKKHLHYSKPIDDEVRRAYQAIAQGKMVIRALESVKAAGVKPASAPDAGWPKLALCRADAISCKIQYRDDGAATMHAGDTNPRSRSRWGRDGVYQSRNVFSFPAGSFPGAQRWRTAEALVPTPPLHLRPRRGLANYHVLWEAEWTKIVPHDPLLLRRIGIADIWIVVAAWELTEIEKAALATRITP